MTPKKVSRKSSVRGQGLTEYLILLILISVVSIAAARTLGTTIKGKIQEAQRHINSDISVDGGGNSGRGGASTGDSGNAG